MQNAVMWRRMTIARRPRTAQAEVMVVGMIVVVLMVLLMVVMVVMVPSNGDPSSSNDDSLLYGDSFGAASA